MNPDEQLLHQFYAGDTNALDELSRRNETTLARIGYQLLLARTGSAVQVTEEWDLSERLDAVWELVLMSREVNMGRWPHQRLTVLTWLIHLLCQETDRHLGFRPPY